MFNLFRKKKAEARPAAKATEPMPDHNYCKLAMTEKFQKNIESLGTPIKKFSMSDEMLLEKYPGKTVYQYYFKKPAMVVGYKPEPTNKYDPNAILITINDLPVGYLYRDDQALFHRLNDSGYQLEVIKIDGGAYRGVCDGYVKRGFSDYTIIINQTKK